MTLGGFLPFGALGILVELPRAGISVATDLGDSSVWVGNSDALFSVSPPLFHRSISSSSIGVSPRLKKGTLVCLLQQIRIAPKIIKKVTTERTVARVIMSVRLLLVASFAASAIPVGSGVVVAGNRGFDKDEVVVEDVSCRVVNSTGGEGIEIAVVRLLKDEDGVRVGVRVITSVFVTVIEVLKGGNRIWCCNGSRTSGKRPLASVC